MKLSQIDSQLAHQSHIQRGESMTLPIYVRIYMNMVATKFQNKGMCVYQALFLLAWKEAIQQIAKQTSKTLENHK